MMMNEEPSLSHYKTKAGSTQDIRHHVEFDEPARMFTCMATKQPCQSTHAHGKHRILREITCSICKQTWKALDIPHEWKAMHLWTTDPGSMPEAMQRLYAANPPRPTVASSTAPFASSNSRTTGAHKPNIPLAADVDTHLADTTIYVNSPTSLLEINR